ncbi:MAG TPA: DNA replication and repair protein RecF, partial [Patescibacteria group bacterium]
MLLKSLSLQNFRSYKQSEFNFNEGRTLIIAQNGIGKTNLIEAIFLLATGKSFRAEKEKQLIQFGKEVCRIVGEIEFHGEAEKLEIVFVDQGTPLLRKKYQVNGVSKRRADFAGHLTVVLFTPMDLDLVSGQPSNRRRFLDEVLEQVDADYRLAHTLYTKALRQRNALLEKVQETGIRNEKLFTYWDELLIKNGKIITEKREGLINFINGWQKDFFSFSLTYDHSLISQERLLKYKEAEVGAGVTLVGPHRDDIKFEISNLKFLITNGEAGELDARYFASRGQQRLIVLELKLAQIAYLEEKNGQEPLLLLDDIFSEL